MEDVRVCHEKTCLCTLPLNLSLLNHSAGVMLIEGRATCGMRYGVCGDACPCRETHAEKYAELDRTLAERYSAEAGSAADPALRREYSYAACLAALTAAVYSRDPGDWSLVDDKCRDEHLLVDIYDDLELLHTLIKAVNPVAGHLLHARRALLLGSPAAAPGLAYRYLESPGSLGVPAILASVLGDPSASLTEAARYAARRGVISGELAEALTEAVELWRRYKSINKLLADPGPAAETVLGFLVKAREYLRQGNPAAAAVLSCWAAEVVDKLVTRHGPSVAAELLAGIDVLAASPEAVDAALTGAIAHRLGRQAYMYVYAGAYGSIDAAVARLVADYLESAKPLADLLVYSLRLSPVDAAGAALLLDVAARLVPFIEYNGELNEQRLEAIRRAADVVLDLVDEYCFLHDVIREAERLSYRLRSLLPGETTAVYTPHYIILQSSAPRSNAVHLLTAPASHRHVIIAFSGDKWLEVRGDGILGILESIATEKPLSDPPVEGRAVDGLGIYPVDTNRSIEYKLAEKAQAARVVVTHRLVAPPGGEACIYSSSLREEVIGGPFTAPRYMHGVEPRLPYRQLVFNYLLARMA